MYVFKFIDKDMFERLIKERTISFAVVNGKLVNCAYILCKLIEHQPVWNRVALCIKMLSSLNSLVPVPIAYSHEYYYFTMQMYRFKISRYIDYEKAYISFDELPREQREILKEYTYVKKVLWKPLAKRIKKDKIVRGNKATYIIQSKSQLIDFLCRKSLLFLRIVEKLLVPRKWDYESLSEELCGEGKEGVVKRMLKVLEAYDLIGYSKRYNSLVLKMSGEDIKRCLWRLHLKRCKLADRILTRLAYALLRERGYDHLQALRELDVRWKLPEKVWYGERFRLKSAIPQVVEELVSHGYISDYERELAREYGII